MQKRRDAIADKLEKHLKNVLKIEKKSPGSLYMGDYVKEITLDDEGNICGSVCCMIGWLPTTFPTEYKLQQTDWNDVVVYTIKGRARGVPLKLRTTFLDSLCAIWSNTVNGVDGKKFAMPEIDATVDEVKKTWRAAIRGIRNGELDNQLAPSWKR